MLLNIAGVLILLALIALFAWLAVRAWGSKRWWLKFPGVVLAGLLTLGLVLLTGVLVIGLVKLNAPVNYPVANIKVAGTAEQIKRGEKLTGICVGCHSTANKRPLDGSKDNFVADGPPVGVIYAPNLTPGGDLKNWTDGEIIRAFREGVHRSGRPLIIMPAIVLHNLSDADAQAVVAFLRSQPAVQRDVPERNLNLLAAFFVGAGIFPTSVQPPITQPVVAPPEGITAEYGQYLVKIGGCADCHGADYTGVTEGFNPHGPNITVIVPRWSEADFVKFFRTGVDPTGKTVSEEMPVGEYAGLSDADLKAMFKFLSGLAPTIKPAR